MKQNLETSIQNAPLGNLKIINCRGVEQYYLDSAETRTSYPNGKYLRKSDFELAGKLAQRNYDEKLLSEVEKQLKNIQNIIKKYEKQEIVQVEELYSVYDRMSPSRKKMVDARIISDKEYVNQWSAKIYSGKDFAEGQAEIYTEKKDGVQPEFDIRTDRFEVAIEAMDKINQSAANQIAKSKGETEAVKNFGTEVKTDPEKS